MHVSFLSTFHFARRILLSTGIIITANEGNNTCDFMNTFSKKNILHINNLIPILKVTG